jgi:hypothetical protein
VAELLVWLFWFGVAVLAYNHIAASIRYFFHLREGARIIAAQALLRSLLSMAGLVLLLYESPHFLPG